MTTTETTATDEELEREVKRLLAAGEHATAAAALRHAGHHARAAKIYEHIFEHRAALSAWEEAGDLVSAVRVALTLDDNAALDRLVGDAIARGLGDALLSALQKAGRQREVARVWRARGELLLAARAFEDAGALPEAASCLEELGQPREAGLLLERWLELHPEDDDAALRLGRVLARFGRHDDAIALLQRALRGLAGDAGKHDLFLCRAAPTLALAFVALGYEEAARATLSRWQAAHRRRVTGGTRDPALAEAPPASLEELLSSARAAAFAAVQQTSTRTPAKAAGPPPRATGGAAAAASPFEDPLPAADERPQQALATHAEVDSSVDLAEQRLLLNGRYLLGEPLGGGGVGQVFRAYDAFADRPVAVKIFGAQVLSSDAVQAWAREVRAAAAIQHPAIVKLVELNMAQGFVVTELHGEGDGAVLLEDRLRQGGPAGWLLPTLTQILDALAAAHRTGLVHGGLKPQNVFLVPGGIKLLDIGAHRLLALRSTETGGLASVWPYLSPEMLFGGAADVDGDLYATAAITYRALTGHPPFSAATADRTQPPPPASSRNPAVPESWSLFLARALSPRRDERFASAEEMRAALPGPLAIELPRATSLGGADEKTTATTTTTDRYVKQGLVQRFGEGNGAVKVWAARDALVGRAVFLLEAQDPATGQLLPYVACARLWRGVQPVYDVIADDSGTLVQAVVIAGSEHRGQKDLVADLAALRAVPQGLTRDLTAVIEALKSLHEQGFAVGGFDVERARGPIGPRLRLAPAPLLVPATPQAIAADEASFAALVELAFGVADDPTLDARGRLLAALHDGRFLERQDLEALAAVAHEPWPRFLARLTERLVAGAQSRVVARLVRSIVKGT